jgi:ABC-type branched-subunit amino acid transport system substrate-binding protein
MVDNATKGPDRVNIRSMLKSDRPLFAVRDRSRALSLVVVTALSSTMACIERGEPIESIKVGLLVPNSGGLASLGKSWENAARLAVEQINSAGGLFDGREMEVLIEDSGSDPGPAEQATKALLEEGVVGIVGPASSSEVARVKPLTDSASVPLLSCCATSASLTEAQTDRNGYFFRTAPNDNYQAEALAFLGANGTRGPHPSFTGAGPGETLDSCPDMIIIAQDDEYGSKLAAGLETTFAGRDISTFDVDGEKIPLLDDGGQPAIGRVILNQAFTAGFAQGKDPNDPDVIAAAALVIDPVLAAFVAPSGHDFTWNPNTCFTIVAFGEDGAAVFSELHRRLVGLVNTIRTDVADPRYDENFVLNRVYLGPDGMNDSAFATNAGAFAPLLVGTAPTHAANTAYGKFDNAFRARFSTPPGSFTSQMFDATMLLGLAITSANAADGESIRDAIFEVSRTGQRFDGAFFGEMAEALLRGDDIDYVGPSGELDMDDAGDIIGDYALWRAQLAGSTYSIAETDFLPAADFALPR